MTMFVRTKWHNWDDDDKSLPILHLFLGNSALWTEFRTEHPFDFLNDPASVTYFIKLDFEWEANLIMIHQPRSDAANTNTDVTNGKDGSSLMPKCRGVAH